jgi:hypothetical protein
MTDKFKDYRGRYHIHSIGPNRLEISSNKDTYDQVDTEPSQADWEEAYKIAAELNMRITGGRTSWQGYSEYTPDPGDVATFDWEERK